MTDNDRAVLTHMLLSIREQATAALRMVTAGQAMEQEPQNEEPSYFGDGAPE